MINESRLRKKFPSKNPGKNIAAKKKAIQMEYRRKRAELGIGPPQLKRGFPYYMVIILGMVLVGGLVGSAIFERGGVDLSGKKNEKAIASLENLAVALGRYRYHTGVYPSTEEGLEQLSKTRLNVPGWLGPYIKEIKPDPWGNPYVYVNDAEGKDPVLYSCGPDARSGTTDDVLVERSFFDVPFKDVTWTEGWVPWHLRDIMWVENEREKELAERRVAAALAPATEPEEDGRSAADSVKVNVLKATEAVAEIRVDKVVSRFDGTNTVVETESRNYTIDKPRLWSFDNPVIRRGNLAGEYVIRTLEPSTSESILLNGHETRIKGVVSDTSLGILGGTFSVRQAEVKFTALKESGVNTVYFADPKTPKGFYSLCDRIGLLALDESEVKRLRLDIAKFVPARGLLSEADLAYVKSRFMPDTKTLYAGPHWNWTEGGKALVECVTDADSVELFVNGESAGEATKIADLRFSKEVVYEAGELKAIAKKNGVYYTDRVLKTAYEPEALRFDTYPWVLKEGESVILTVAATDDLGRVVPGADFEVEFTVEEGPGEFIVCSDGRIDSPRKAVAKLRNGRASVAVRRGPFSRIPLRITAKSPGKRSALAFLPYLFR